MAQRMNVEDWERLASVVAGMALVAAGAKRRHWIPGVAGAALVARGAAGFCPVNAVTGRSRLRDDPRAALAGSRGIRLEEGVTIGRPVEEVFDFWRDLTNLPKFMTSLERVDVIDDRLSHWVVRGPGRMRIAWDAEIIVDERPVLLSWQSLPGADVASAGSIRLRSRASGTELRVLMQYNPPAGKFGAAVAWLAGQSPESQLREELRRLKQLLETGEVPTAEGQPSGTRRPALTTRWVETIS